MRNARLHVLLLALAATVMVPALAAAAVPDLPADGDRRLGRHRGCQAVEQGIVDEAARDARGLRRRSDGRGGCLRRNEDLLDLPPGRQGIDDERRTLDEVDALPAP